MSEPKPVYTTEQESVMPANMTHHIDEAAAIAAAIVADTRRTMTYAALDDAGAAQRALLALVAEVERLRNLLGLGGLDIDALAAVRHSLRDLRRQAEALGVGL